MLDLALVMGYFTKFIEYPPEPLGVNWKLLVDRPNFPRTVFPKSFNLPSISSVSFFFASSIREGSVLSDINT